MLTEDQSTYIPLCHTHRLENPGKVPLELIEVQSGFIWVRMTPCGLRMFMEGRRR